MTPPPIRYPLPTLVLLAALGLAAWRGAALLRPVRAALATRWERVVSGPPVPSSTRPQVVAGAMVRRVLLERDGVPASDRPVGPTVETIRFRMFADVYDVWPLSGPPTHYRVGNRRPIGWVAAADALPWDTRLVVRSPSGLLPLAESPGAPAGSSTTVGSAPLPVLAWESGAIRVAAWGGDRPWTEVARIGWTSAADLPAGAWGVLLSREELLILLRRANAEDTRTLRLDALLGRLADDRRATPADLDATRPALPAVAFAGAGGSIRRKCEDLARINEQWTPDASWAGLSFRLVPLDALP